MHPELEWLRALATVMMTAERDGIPDVAGIRRRAPANRGRHCGRGQRATGLTQGELLAMLSQNVPSREPSWQRPES
jgi:hypothetical protein